MPSPAPITVVLGTGGTIAGTAASADENVAYRAAQLGVDSLVTAVPALAGLPLQAVQVAQIDSKNMSHAVWQRLARAVAAQLARPAVGGVVITHGTDTLEETAYFLHRVLSPAKPVVLTAAMRPATSLQADGPQNLLDAVTVARTPGVQGVLAVIHGQVFGADGLRKVDAWRLDAFDGAQLGVVEAGRLRQTCAWPAAEPSGLSLVDLDPEAWPRVAWISSHAGFDATQVDALVAAGFDGLLVAGTGNGSLHAALDAALERARAAGVAVRITTRCASGRVVGAVEPQPVGAAQARVALLLELLARRATGRPGP